MLMQFYVQRLTDGARDVQFKRKRHVHSPYRLCLLWLNGELINWKSVDAKAAGFLPGCLG